MWAVPTTLDSTDYSMCPSQRDTLYSTALQRNQSDPMKNKVSHSTLSSLRVKGKTLIMTLDELFSLHSTLYHITYHSLHSHYSSAGRNVPKIQQTHSHLRTFARAVLAAWNSSPRHLHGWPPHFLCIMLSLSPSLAMQCNCHPPPPSPHILFFFSCFVFLHSTYQHLTHSIH